MKNLLKNISIYLFILMMSLNLQAQETQKENVDVNKILKDETQREEIMATISNDPTLRSDMMTHIMNTVAADSIACSNFQGMMMNNEHMNWMMTDMCKNQNFHMRNRMKNNDKSMHRHGHGAME